MGSNKNYLGIELGSTRIKAALINNDFRIVATGFHNWENRFDGGFWTYDLADVWAGLKDAVSQLGGVKVNALGVSAMMHGYLAFDKDDKLLTLFRTWRNTNTARAAGLLTDLFHFNIPLRWSIAHLYQAILDNEPHVKDVAFVTTLAGYVHWRLTGEKVLGIGDASGMFPIKNGTYDRESATAFEKLTGIDIFQIFPRVLTAGKSAGTLTTGGAALLNNIIPAGTPLCPPEGDAGTGMVATNAVRPRTGNVSAGTSVFAMTVLDKPLSKVYPEIDVVTTPDGAPVAMVHCNNCCSDIDAWVSLFAAVEPDKGKLYELFYGKALEGDADCGGLLSFNYLSGEPITGLAEGRPLFARLPDSRFTFANFCRCLLYSSLATLKIGMDILTSEGVTLERISGHGGLYKTTDAGQRLTAAALNVPVTVTEQAAEGGAWGMAVLAAFAASNGKLSLSEYLEQNVFAETECVTIEPNDDDAAGFSAYLARYKEGLAIERAAVENLR